MKNKLFLLMTALFLMSLSFAAGTHAKGVSVRLTGQALFETEPKNVVTTTFKVVNTSDEEQEFIAEVKLPEGWKNLGNAFPFTLGPNAMKVELVSFFVPKHALAGKYEISYMLRSRKHMGVSDLKTIHVMVLPVSKLQVRLLESPDHVIAGEDYLAAFMVINESNVDSALRVKIESGANLPYRIDNEIFSLSPGASKLVKVTVSTDADVSKKFRHHLFLSAFEGESPGPGAEVYVDVIPRVKAVEDRYHRIPSKVTLRQITVRNGEDTTAFQAEFSGEGTLDEDGEKNLRFLFQGPDTQDKSAYGERDAYSVKYWTKNSDLLLGDHSYSLSPLTENYLYGRGIGGNLTYKNFGMGAYYMKSLWAEPDVEETALNFSYRFNKKNRVRLNFLQKNDDEIMSMESGFHLGEKTDLELEWAIGKNDDQYDHAFWMNFQGFHQWLSYYLKYFYAAPDYPGYYQDKEFISANLTIPATENLSFNLTLQQEKNNLDLNTDLDSAPLERYGQLGVDYRFKTNTHLSLDSHVRTREDRLSNPDFKDQEKTLRVGLGHNFEKLSLNASAEVGVKEDRLEHASFDLSRYTGSLYYRARPNQTYSAYLRYGDEEFADENDKRSINAGVSGSFRFSPKTRLDLDVQTYRYPESDSGNRDIFEISASHGLFKNHTISAKARYTAYQDSDEENETFVFAEYTIPVGLPVSAKKGMGSIRGYLSDTESGQAIPNTILRLNGETAVTNKKGEFVFPSLMAGNHYLSVDQAGIGLDKITTQKLPLKVKVEGGKEVSVKISVTQSALVSGQIMGYRFADTDNMFSGNNGNELSEGTGMANILVEMKSALETKRQMTDANGFFKFEELRPGKWQLKIHDSNLPEYHYIEQDVSEFELGPGETKNIWVRVLPQKRHIQMTDGGMLAEELVVATGPEKAEQKGKIPGTGTQKSVPPPIRDGASKIRLGKLRKSSDYTVQVAVYSEQQKARKVLENLRRGGFSPYIVRTKDSDRQEWFTVCFGDYANIREASQAASRFQDKEKRTVIIRPRASLW